LRILGIIPARKGSKRLPDKNLKLLGGKPLICRAIETAIKTPILSEIVVSSDSEEVLNLRHNYPNPQLTFLNRPVAISGDDSPAIDYVNHALDYFPREGKEFDIIVILQPSSPFTLPSDIEGTVNMLLNSSADSSVSVVRLSHDINPLKMKLLKGQRLIPYIEDEKGRMSAEALPEVYVRNCSVYVSRISVIQSGSIIGNECLGYVMPRERSIDINDELDLKFAEFLNSYQMTE